MTPDELLDAYARAFRTADADLARSLIAPGAVIWHNFDQVERDIDASLGELGRMYERFDDLEMEELERFVLADGLGARIVLRCTDRATGEAMVSHQVKLYRIRDGRIARVEEYVAPRVAPS
jgi:ketosteroid isomerase-like protein